MWNPRKITDVVFLFVFCFYPQGLVVRVVFLPCVPMGSSSLLPLSASSSLACNVLGDEVGFFPQGCVSQGGFSFTGLPLPQAPGGPGSSSWSWSCIQFNLLKGGFPFRGQKCFRSLSLFLMQSVGRPGRSPLTGMTPLPYCRGWETGVQPFKLEA